MELDLGLDSRNFRGSRIESQVEFWDSLVTVNLALSGTIVALGPVLVTISNPVSLTPYIA